jgi:hypothetical protein
MTADQTAARTNQRIDHLLRMVTTEDTGQIQTGPLWIECGGVDTAAVSGPGGAMS